MRGRVVGESLPSVEKATEAGSRGMRARGDGAGWRARGCGCGCGGASPALLALCAPLCARALLSALIIGAARGGCSDRREERPALCGWSLISIPLLPPPPLPSTCGGRERGWTLLAESPSSGIWGAGQCSCVRAESSGASCGERDETHGTDASRTAPSVAAAAAAWAAARAAARVATRSLSRASSGELGGLKEMEGRGGGRSGCEKGSGRGDGSSK